MIHNTKMRTVLALALGWVAASWSGVYAAEEVSWADVKEAFVVEAEDGVTYMAFSQEALRRAGKRPVKTVSVTTTDATSAESASVDVDLSAEESRAVSKWFKAKGRGEINIWDENAPGTGADDLNILFQVPNGALSEGVQITMTVHGNYLSDLVVSFQPGGLVFNKDAALLIQVGKELVNVDTAELKVWHEYEDGSVEEAGLALFESTSTGFLEVRADVSGFSRYGIRRGF